MDKMICRLEILAGIFAPEAIQNQVMISNQRDEIGFAAALSAELSQCPDHDEARHDEWAKFPFRYDHRRNIDIGRNVASSIKSIIRDEVDETLDRIARQAVPDALKAHRAI